ncbi:MFS general substrate transporter [Parathielavia hyrcaniae]|uniref:MFS general substrate transporter n=1 Tax=Parathielavia hyrcaniae TaxID=113614 RepID=A0AAN6PQ94_9PEZI|nr:MFS general substrate transporter [Parathielavia hyrcaniae]
MGPPAHDAASVATENASRPSPSRSRLSRASGSFHAGEPFNFSYNESTASRGRPRRPPAAETRRLLRRQSTAKYHTFPTPPPATPYDGHQSPREPRAWYTRLFRPRDDKSDADSQHPDGAPGGSTQYPDEGRRGVQDFFEDEHATPLPWTPLALLALLSLAEQTALNSIGPYLPTMVASFDEIPNGQEGLYVGLLASAFALAQLATNLFWGYLSDRVGRKPTMVLGTSLLAGCFVLFGLCTTYAQLLMVHIAMGLLNGNAAIVPTCLGELTDRTNQSSAFIWLPVIYSLGSITGPALGGLLVGVAGGAKYTFLAPNVFVAALLLSSVVVHAVWFNETLDGGHRSAVGPAWDGLRMAKDWCAARLGRSSVESRGKGKRMSPPLGNSLEASDGYFNCENESSDSKSADGSQHLLESGSEESAAEEDGDSNTDPEDHLFGFQALRNRNTIAVLGTYLVFQLANISFNSLYPIFAAAPPPTGRNLGPDKIGVSLSLAGLATIFFQVSIFQKLKLRMGNLGTYRYSLLGMAISMALMPWIGYVDGNPVIGLGSGKAWLYGELGVTLILKNICAVGGLSSVMLLITNSAPSNETLGTLNGMAQTLSAAGRSFGPLLSGGLFTVSTRVRPKGEALAWGLFAGITLLGWAASYAIRSKGLESAEFTDGAEIDDGDEEQRT